MSIEIGFIEDGTYINVPQCLAAPDEMPVVVDDTKATPTFIMANERDDRCGVNVYFIDDPYAASLPATSRCLLHYVTEQTLDHTVLPGGYSAHYVRVADASGWMVVKHIIDPGVVAPHTAN